MTDTNRDDDPRSDIQQAVESRSDEADAAGGGGTESPLKPTVSHDAAGGAGGGVKNQDEAQQ